MGILIRLVVTAVALWISTLVLHGVTLGQVGTAKKIGTLLVVAAIFGIVNAVLRPIIKVFGCWAYVLTLGLAALVVNGLLFLLTSWIAGRLGLSFHVAGFWWAVAGALLVSVVSWVLNLVVPDGRDR